MGENGKYYWLKLKRDFFKRHDIRIIEEMPNGKDYILFYLKLLLESVDHEGSLRFSDTIPYNEQMLSVVTNTNIDIVRSAMKLFVELNMMSICDDKTIYMNEVEKLIGSAADNDNANRVRRCREKKKQTALQNVTDGITNCNESKSKEKDINTTTTTTNNYLSYLESEEFQLFKRVCQSFKNCGYQCPADVVNDFIAYNNSRDWLGIGGESVLENLDRYVNRWYEGEKRRRGDQQ